MNNSGGVQLEKSEYQAKYEYLRRYQVCQQRIKGLVEELEEWCTIGTSITQRYNIGGGSHNGGSKQETSAVETAAIIAEIRSEIAQAKKCRDDVKNTVEKLGKDAHRHILILHFINGMSVRQIARSQGRTDAAIHKRIRAAIDSLELPG